MTWRRAIWALILVAAAGILVENWVLIRQNYQLRGTLRERFGRIVAGRRLTRIEGVGLDGRLTSIGVPASGGLLVITFSAGCPTCRENRDGWLSLAGAVSARGWRVLWVSRDPVDVTRDYCVREGIPLSDVVAEPPYWLYWQLGLHRVPDTISVGKGGTVARVWPGVVAGSNWKRALAYLTTGLGAGGTGARSTMSSEAGCGAGAVAAEPGEPCR